MSFGWRSSEEARGVDRFARFREEVAVRFGIGQVSTSQADGARSQGDEQEDDEGRDCDRARRVLAEDYQQVDNDRDRLHQRGREQERAPACGDALGTLVNGN